MTISDNPYDSPKTESRAKPNVTSPPFITGCRNGFLWSLVLAIPTLFVVDSELLLGMTNQTMGISHGLTRDPITVVGRLSVFLNAVLITFGIVTLPWALTTGVVKWLSDTGL